MIVDYVLPKPPTAGGYALHRMIEGLTNGAAPLFTDMGDRLLVRSAAPIAGLTAQPLKDLAAGEITAFQLRASVSRKTRGKRSYYPPADWAARHHWLRRQGERLGFEVLTVHCSAAFAPIDKTGQRFTVDRTDFTGVLKVTDAEKFSHALRDGVGSCSRAFGFGMLLI